MSKLERGDGQENKDVVEPLVGKYYIIIIFPSLSIFSNLLKYFLCSNFSLHPDCPLT